MKRDYSMLLDTLEKEPIPNEAIFIKDNVTIQHPLPIGK